MMKNTRNRWSLSVSIYFMTTILVVLFAYFIPSKYTFLTSVALFAPMWYVIFIGILKAKIPLNYFSLMSFGISFGYGMGSFATYFSAPELFDSSLVIDKYIFALLIAILCAGFSGLACFLFSSFRPALIIYNNSGENPAILVVVAAVMLIYCYGTGIMDYQGISVEEGKIQPLAAIMAAVTPVLPALILCSAENRRHVNFFMMAVLLPVVVLCALPFGRRIIISIVLFTVMMMNVRGLRQSPVKFSLLFLAFIAAAAAFSTVVTVTMRITSYGIDSEASIIERADTAISNLQSHGIQDVFSYLEDNNRSRAFLLRFLSDLLDSLNSKEALGGVETLESLKISIPSVFGVKKYTGDIENIAQQKFSLNVIDEANTLLTTGVSDFGVLGGILFPMLMAGVFQALSTTIRRAPISMLSKRVMIMMFLFLFVNIEVALSGYFSVIRNAVIVGGLLAIALRIMRVFRPVSRARTGPDWTAQLRRPQ